MSKKNCLSDHLMLFIAAAAEVAAAAAAAVCCRDASREKTFDMAVESPALLFCISEAMSNVSDAPPAMSTISGYINVPELLASALAPSHALRR
jgi:hypothetical protein